MINTQNHNTVDIFDKKIAVLGLGLSGLGAAKLANHLGARVMVSDSNPNKKTSKDALLLMQSHHIAIETGIHSPEIYKADLWIVSPGIPKDSPIVQIAQEKKIPIISEIEFASWYTSSKIIAITGSNGKTTTAHILYLFNIKSLASFIASICLRSTGRCIISPTSSGQSIDIL